MGAKWLWSEKRNHAATASADFGHFDIYRIRFRRTILRAVSTCLDYYVITIPCFGFIREDCG